jgi:DNA (cytosine-5)-methyltransferase 1
VTTLPTPCARDGKGPGHQRGLPDLLEGGRVAILRASGSGTLLPTPTATDYGSNRSRSAGATVRPSLARLVQPLPSPLRPLLPTPTAADSRSSANATAGRRTPTVRHAGRTLTDAARLLPTPRATDGPSGSPGQRGSHGDLTLPAAAVRILPTPTVSDSRGPGPRGDGGPNLRTTASTLPTAGPQDGETSRWGVYAGAVARWEHLHGRAAPEPTQPGQHGKPVLAPPFVEWLMGLEPGWVTAPELGLPRTQALRVLGNGVMPQQPPPRCGCCCAHTGGR